MGRESLVGPMLERDTRRLYRTLKKHVLSREVLRSLQEPLNVALCSVGLFVCLMVLGMPASEVLKLMSPSMTNHVTPRSGLEYELTALSA